MVPSWAVKGNDYLQVWETEVDTILFAARVFHLTSPRPAPPYTTPLHHFSGCWILWCASVAWSTSLAVETGQ